jgi:hypothetical protein
MAHAIGFSAPKDYSMRLPSFIARHQVHRSMHSGRRVLAPLRQGHGHPHQSQRELLTLCALMGDTVIRVAKARGYNASRLMGELVAFLSHEVTMTRR